MFNAPVLDLVILLSFTYFIGSLLLSAINEALAGTLRLRQKDLAEALNNFFFSPAWRVFVKNRLMQSPNIETLMRSKGRTPAYIPARNFVLAIIEHLDAVKYREGEIAPLTKQAIIASKDEKGFIDAVLPNDILTVLETLMKQVGAFTGSDRTSEFEKRLEEFYNLTMDRAIGWYKRKIRKILFVLGLALAVALNIDTIKIVNDAVADKGKMAKAVDNIAANLGTYKQLADRSLIVDDDSGTIAIGTAVQTANDIVLKYEKTTGYELGYSSWEAFKYEWTKQFLKKLLGVLLTAFALQMGANYWFDVLNKAVNVRAAGRKPDQIRPATKSSNT